jgi:hypothetical protein
MGQLAHLGHRAFAFADFLCRHVGHLAHLGHRQAPGRKGEERSRNIYQYAKLKIYRVCTVFCGYGGLPTRIVT